MNTRMENYGHIISAGITPKDADELQRISRSLHRLDEKSCNGYQTYGGEWDEAGEKKAEKREERIEAKGKAIAEKYGFLFYHQSDPRGWSVYLVKPEELNGYSLDSNYSRGLAICPQ